MKTNGIVGASVRFVRLFGVEVRLHYSLLAAVLLLLVFAIGRGQSGRNYAIYAAALCVSVVLHELGHVMASDWYGIRTREIVLSPIATFAVRERAPQPHEQVRISLAGPAMNVFLAEWLFALLTARNVFVPIRELSVANADPLEIIAIGNLLLALLNLVPLPPMDGGRIVRALTALRGRPQPGRGEDILAGGVPVRSAMITDFRTLAHGDTVQDAANVLTATSQEHFPVLHGGRVTGCVSRAALLKAAAGGGAECYIAGLMERNCPRFSPGADLAEALPALSEPGACALVVEEERVLGLLTSEHVCEYLLLRRSGSAT